MARYYPAVEGPVLAFADDTLDGRVRGAGAGGRKGAGCSERRFQKGLWYLYDIQIAASWPSHGPLDGR